MTKEEYIKKHGIEAYQKLLERNRQNYKKNKNNWKATREQYYENNKSFCRNLQKDYYYSVEGRAKHLLHSYQTNDLKYNRGECTIDEEYIINNIFTKPCIYCGETDYTKLGCDRIDNSKPHTPDNVVPCCRKCNLERQKQDYSSFLLRHNEPKS